MKIQRFFKSVEIPLTLYGLTLMIVGFLVIIFQDKFLEIFLILNKTKYIFISSIVFIVLGFGMFLLSYLEDSKSLDSIQEESNELIKRFRLAKDKIDDLNIKHQSKNINYNIEKQVIEDSLFHIKSRLTLTIESLNKKGNLNLVIGVLTTVVAILVLSTFLVFDQKTENITIWLFDSLPRFTLGIFIEIFAFFFLKLYKSNLNEIKYFQNELTNIEFKFVALENAILLKNTKVIDEILISFVNTERNFLLNNEKDEISIEKTLSNIATITKNLKS